MEKNKSIHFLHTRATCIDFCSLSYMANLIKSSRTIISENVNNDHGHGYTVSNTQYQPIRSTRTRIIWHTHGRIQFVFGHDGETNVSVGSVEMSSAAAYIIYNMNPGMTSNFIDIIICAYTFLVSYSRSHKK